jgi:hypothetical protein
MECRKSLGCALYTKCALSIEKYGTYCFCTAAMVAQMLCLYVQCLFYFIYLFIASFSLALLFHRKPCQHRQTAVPFLCTVPLRQLPSLVRELWCLWRILSTTDHGFGNHGFYSLQFETLLTKKHRPRGSRISSVDIVTRYDLDNRGIGFGSPAEKRGFYLLQLSDCPCLLWKRGWWNVLPRFGVYCSPDLL